MVASSIRDLWKQTIGQLLQSWPRTCDGSRYVSLLRSQPRFDVVSLPKPVHDLGNCRAKDDHVHRWKDKENHRKQHLDRGLVCLFLS